MSKKNQVLASLVKPTVVANTRVWSFIVEKLQSKMVVIHGLCTQNLALYEATGQAKWLRKPLPGIDNGRQQQYTIQMFSLLWQYVKCAAKHIDNGLYVAKEKIQNHMKSWSTKVSSKCLRIRLPKGLPPKSTWVLREAYDFWITKGPKERLKSCFNTERYIVAVKSDGN